MTRTTWTRRITSGFAVTAAAAVALTAASTPATARPLSRTAIAAPVAATPISGPFAALRSERDTARSTSLPTFLTECSANSYQGDKRLGPARLPRLGLVGLEMIGYRRTGDLSTADFLAQYYDSTLNGGTGGWIYPPQNGYQLHPNGTPIRWDQQLFVGQQIDRYGSEYGGFLAPTGLPYVTRAIPPSNLNGSPPAGCNYHNYRVRTSFSVDAGPIAPWFAQPGGGLQYQLDATEIPGAPSPLNVLWLVQNGYLERLN
jgi:hypothetical protein